LYYIFKAEDPTKHCLLSFIETNKSIEKESNKNKEIIFKCVNIIIGDISIIP